MKIDDSGQIIEKYSSIKFHENPYSKGRRIDLHDEVFRNFVNEPKNYQHELNDNGSILGKRILSLYRQCEWPSLLELLGTRISVPRSKSGTVFSRPLWWIVETHLFICIYVALLSIVHKLYGHTVKWPAENKLETMVVAYSEVLAW